MALLILESNSRLIIFNIVLDRDFRDGHNYFVKSNRLLSTLEWRALNLLEVYNYNSCDICRLTTLASVVWFKYLFAISICDGGMKSTSTLR